MYSHRGGGRDTTDANRGPKPERLPQREAEVGNGNCTGTGRVGWRSSVEKPGLEKRRPGEEARSEEGGANTRAHPQSSEHLSRLRGPAFDLPLLWGRAVVRTAGFCVTDKDTVLQIRLSVGILFITVTYYDVYLRVSMCIYELLRVSTSTL